MSTEDPVGSSRDVAVLSDPMRLAALDRTGLLNAPPDESFDWPARLIGRVLRVPVALLSLLDERRQVIKGAVGLAGDLEFRREIPLSQSICACVVTAGAPVVVGDMRRDARLARHPGVREFGVRAYVGMPLRTRSGQVLGALCAIDLKPRTWSNDDIATLAEVASAAAGEIDLRTALHARERALAVISHDLQAPLQSVRLYAALLRRREETGEPTPEQSAQWLRKIERGASRIMRMIQELLDVAHLEESGRLPEIKRRRVDIVSLVHNVAEEINSMSQRRVAVRAAVCALLGEWDADRLERLIENLVSNALKYSPEDGEVLIEVRPAIEGGRHGVRIEIRDQGVGIPARDLPHIFEQYYRASNVSSAVAGSGVGLASARLIVEQHGGSIAVHSTEGRGSCFSVWLPIEAPVVAQQSAALRGT